MHALSTLDWWLFRLLFGLAALALFLLVAVAIRAAEWLIDRLGSWRAGAAPSSLPRPRTG